MTCKSVFILSSPCTYSVTYWCDWDETSVKPRQCALLPEITTICAKWLNSLYLVPPTVLGLFYGVVMIYWWLGIRYMSSHEVTGGLPQGGPSTLLLPPLRQRAASDFAILRLPSNQKVDGGVWATRLIAGTN